MSEPECFSRSSGQRTYVFDGGVAFKIGRATKPEQRLRDCQTGSPVKLTLLAVGCQDDEGALHGIFRKWRSHGEWFSSAGMPRLTALLSKAHRFTGGCISCALRWRFSREEMKRRFLSRYPGRIQWKTVKCTNPRHWNADGWVDRYGEVPWSDSAHKPSMPDTARTAAHGELNAEAVWAASGISHGRGQIPGLSTKEYSATYLLTDSDQMDRYLACVHTVEYWRPGCIACAGDTGLVASDSNAASWHRRWAENWSRAA